MFVWLFECLIDGIEFDRIGLDWTGVDGIEWMEKQIKSLFEEHDNLDNNVSKANNEEIVINNKEQDIQWRITALSSLLK